MGSPLPSPHPPSSPPPLTFPNSPLHLQGHGAPALRPDLVVLAFYSSCAMSCGDHLPPDRRLGSGWWAGKGTPTLYCTFYFLTNKGRGGKEVTTCSPVTCHLRSPEVPCHQGSPGTWNLSHVTCHPSPKDPCFLVSSK